MINLKRAYEKPDQQDGFRVLVERLWPRGLKKEAVALDLWLKDIAPSPELRRWFGHDPARWEEFCRRYWIELAERPAAVKVLREKLREGNVTLVYGSRDQEHNAAVALRNSWKMRPRIVEESPSESPHREASSCNGSGSCGVRWPWFLLSPPYAAQEDNPCR